MKALQILVAALAVPFVCGCTPAEVPIKTFSVAGSADLVEGSPATFDGGMSFDGNGSLKIALTQATTVPLFETGDLDVEDNRIMYRAKIKTEDVQGQVYLEMWCVFGQQQAFSRALRAPLTGTNDWTMQATPFFLKSGENPDNILLNIVATGPGTVWVDDIEVTRLDK